MGPSFYHLKFESLGSTQSFLTNYPNIENKFLLVSSLKQTSGRGRRDNTWISHPDSLSFSFNLPAKAQAPLALDLGNSIVEFMKERNIPLKLKWPNDIYTLSGFKCGGIITERKKKIDFIGIGLNTLFQKNEFISAFETENKIGAISINQKKLDCQHELPYQILDFIISRSSEHFCSQKWQKNCIHHNKQVIWSDKNSSYQGKNTGIDKEGGILIEGEEGVKTFYSGSLGIL